MRNRLWFTFVGALAVGALLTAPAGAWVADFFEKSASGNAIYESMVIHPEAVYDAVSDSTYLAYQGYGLDPYVTGYNHGESSWGSASVVGTNTLGDDAHGGPALIIDGDGYLNVFYGSHGTALRHARSRYPHSDDEWVDLGPIIAGGRTLVSTYCQPHVETSGTIRLFVRSDWGATKGDWVSVASSRTADGGVEWSAPEILLDGSTYDSTQPTSTGDYWYINTAVDSSGGYHVAAVWRNMRISTNQFLRQDVYYFNWQPGVGAFAANGESVTATLTMASRRSLETTGIVVDTGDEYSDQVVVRENASGDPMLLYLVGTNDPPAYTWRCARWDGSAWVESVITGTDNLFDAGTFEITPQGIDAFLVTGGMPDDQALPAEQPLATRGGDITLWHSDDGTDWSLKATVIASRDASTRYNDPQIVSGHADGARLLFCEWDNDESNYIRKVFLWNDDGFVGREFTPEIHRLAGSNRIETSVEVSKQGFPAGASTVVVASAWDYPDVLCGVPLAQSYRAPVLQTDSQTAAGAVCDEIRRLRATNAIVLGGLASVSSTAYAEIGAAISKNAFEISKEKGKTVLASIDRIGGSNRYETSALIAEALAKRRGLPRRAILASGASFADALSVSPYAARHGYPILLTSPSVPVTATIGAIKSLEPSSIVVVGGKDAVSAEVVNAYGGYTGATERWAGQDRYQTARTIAEHSLAEGQKMERFVLASGQAFPDAVSGGLLAARYNGVMLLTPSGWLHPATQSLIVAQGGRVLDVYVLGGGNAVSPDVENVLAHSLYEH
ncbi:MAG: cell wall-binding repeat-containing protein [Anaerosomatales bacterium]|nr:cell wall-binding repeat-containing protein [Anaerosomatales bacterium]